MKKIHDKGIKVIQADVRPFQEAAQPVFEKYRPQFRGPIAFSDVHLSEKCVTLFIDREPCSVAESPRKEERRRKAVWRGSVRNG